MPRPNPSPIPEPAQANNRNGWHIAAGLGLLAVSGLVYASSTAAIPFTLGSSTPGYKPATALGAAGIAFLIGPSVLDTLEENDFY